MSVGDDIPEALAGERLDRVVALSVGCSRAEAAALVEAGAVRLDGRVVTTKSHRVGAGDRLDVDDEDGALTGAVEPDPAVPVPVVHVDADVVVVDKPPGLVVHPGAGNATGTLVHGLLAQFPELSVVGDPARPGLVHRLDRDTSGLLVVARTPDAHASLVSQLARREVGRRYLTVVWGHPEAASGMVDAPVGRSRHDRLRMAVTEHGRPAVTRYEVVDRFDQPVRVALLTCTLETGRTHQIRVHLSAIGHPVVGDDRYDGARPTLAVPRMFLHATELAFRHPTTGEPLQFRSPLPPDLTGVLAGLS